MKTEIISIREAIKTRAAKQVELRKSRTTLKATEPKSDDRSLKLNSMHWNKLFDRQNLRELYLAYAYARGKSYLVTEPVTNPNKKVYLDQYVSRVLTAYGIKVTKDQVKAWFEGEMPYLPEIAEVQSAAE